MDYSKYDYVGGSVGICNDGSRYVVGAPGINLKTYRRYMNDTKENEKSITDGAAYVFYNNTVQKIKPPEKITGPDYKDRFAACTRISGDGNTVAIGSYNAEHVYVYQYQNNQYEYDYEISVEECKMFGYNLWVSGNGQDIVIGAHEQGKDVVFHYRNGVLLHQIEPIELDKNRQPKHFGRSIWLSDDAQTLMIGSSGNSTVYEFAYVDDEWVQTGLIKQEEESEFGCSISRDDDDYLIGAKNGSFAMHNDIKISGLENTGFGGSVKLRHDYIVVGNFMSYDDWFGYSVDIFPNGNILVGSPLYKKTGRYQILTPQEAQDAGLFCEKRG